MKNVHALILIACSFVLTAPSAFAVQQSHGSAEDASASKQYQSLNLTKDPHAAPNGDYKADPHHTSVTVKLAHMDLSRYTLRFDAINGRFTFDPVHAIASNLVISIDPNSIDTGNPTFDKKIAKQYFEADKYPSITFTSSSVKLTGDHVQVEGVLDFHGVKKPMTLNVVYRGLAEGRMGFSGDVTFKRSDFGVGEWIPLEADDVSVLIETEFVKR